MKILHCADLHGNLRWYDWLLREAKNHDLVVIAGDLIDQLDGEAAGIAAQVSDVSARLRDFPVPLAICSGNHDLVSATEGPVRWLQALRRPGLWADGDRFELSSVRFRCLEWNGTLPRSAGAGEIWISHAPPAESKAATNHLGEDWGDFEMGELCRTERGPRLLLGGHVHSRQSWTERIGRTTVINPGFAGRAPRPNWVALDLVAGRATFFPAGSAFEVAEF